jgi:hypothetical protein
MDTPSGEALFLRKGLGEERAVDGCASVLCVRVEMRCTGVDDVDDDDNDDEEK